MPEEFFGAGDETADAFLANLTGEPEKKAAQGAAEAGTPEDTPDAAQGAEGAQEGASEADATDPDDAEVEWSDGEGDAAQPVKAKLRDLKDAYRQREASTEAGRQHEEARARAAAESERAGTALNKMLERAKARWEPYSKLDFLVLAQQVDAETLTAIRKDALDAMNDVKFLEQELDTAVQAGRQQSQARIQAEAQAAIKELGDPVKGIPGWSKELYGQILEHAKGQGAPVEALNGIYAPWAIKMLHKAMLYDKGVAKAAAATRVVNKPTKVITSGTGKTPGDIKGDAKGSAMAALKRSGSTDAAADAFLASFGAE